MNIERGKYWDEACNPIVTDRCQCEVANCWAKDMLRRFPTLNPSPDENGVGLYPKRLQKIKVAPIPKVETSKDDPDQLKIPGTETTKVKRGKKGHKEDEEF